MPNHRMNSGTQAIDGIARSACSVGSSELARAGREAGERAERRARRRRPSRKPGRHPPQRRQHMAEQLAASARARPGSRRPVEGGGSSRASIQPEPGGQLPSRAATLDRQEQAEQPASGQEAARRPARRARATVSGRRGRLSRVLIARCATRGREAGVEQGVDRGATSTSALMISAFCSACPAARMVVALRRRPAAGRTNSVRLELLGGDRLRQLRRPAARIGWQLARIGQRPLPAALVDGEHRPTISGCSAANSSRTFSTP